MMVCNNTSVEKLFRKKGSDKIAVVNLSGIITDSSSTGGFSSGANSISSVDTVRLLDEIEKDDSIKAVVIRINSPGGAVVASDEIYQKVRSVRNKKPVVVSMSDAAASGGYYIASGADKIVANPATITGSIGVIAELPKYDGLLNKIGVEVRTIKSGKYKDIGSPVRDLTPDEQHIFDTMISEAYDQFVSAIVQGRKMDEGKVRELADGRIYTGKQAKENGLVDELGGFDNAVSEAEKLANISNATLVEFSEQNFFESLFQSRLSGISGLDALNNVLPQQKFGVYYLLTF